MALACCPRHAARGACFSEDRRYRYGLWRRWARGGPWVTFLMLNPSLADIEHSDPTVTRCERFSQAWGCAGIEVVNVFGLISPQPRDLFGKRDPVDHVTGANDAHIRRAVARSDFVVAAWGTHAANPRFAGRLQAIARIVRGHDVRALRVTQAGHPSHPLYLPSTAKPLHYEVTAP